MTNTETRKYSDNERRAAIIATAVDTPQSENGLRIDLRLCLYSDGHVGLSIPGGRNEQIFSCRDDYESIGEVAAIIGKLRARVTKASK
jgi:hypothetical protein